MDTVIKDLEAKMKKTIEYLKQNFAKLRTGRASSAILEGIKVEYYHALTPLKQLGNISTPDSKSITIHPWDTTIIGEIEKAILKSDLGLTPLNDGKLIRINIPALTEERRRDLVKLVKKMNEECKVSLRQHRRDGIESLKKMEKDKEISEDDERKGSQKIQNVLDSYIKNADDITKNKEKEIMEV